MRATRQPPSAEISIDDFREMMHRAKTARRRFRKGHTPRRDAVAGPRHVPSRARTSSIIFTRATRPVARLFARSTAVSTLQRWRPCAPGARNPPRGGRVRRGHEPAADHARGTPPDHPRAEFHRAEEDAFRPESQGPRRDFAPPLPPATIPPIQNRPPVPSRESAFGRLHSADLAPALLHAPPDDTFRTSYRRRMRTATVSWTTPSSRPGWWTRRPRSTSRSSASRTRWRSWSGST